MFALPESYQLSFGKIDNDNSKSIELQELAAYFGYHEDGDLISDWSASESYHSADHEAPSEDSSYVEESPHTPASRASARKDKESNTAPEQRRRRRQQSAGALPAITYTSAPQLTALELINIFKTLDANGDGEVSHVEFLKGLKKHPTIAEKLGMPTDIRAEDGTRDSYQLAFGQIDNNDSKSIDLTEVSPLAVICVPRSCVFVARCTALSSNLVPDVDIQFWHALVQLLEFYGHLDLEREKLRGLLLLCGYDDDGINAIFGRAGLLSVSVSSQAPLSTVTPSHFSVQGSAAAMGSTSAYDSGEDKTEAALDTIPEKARRAQMTRQKQRETFLKRMSAPQTPTAGGVAADDVDVGERHQVARKLSFEELKEIFGLLDKDSDGSITHTECIIGLKRYKRVSLSGCQSPARVYWCRAIVYLYLLIQQGSRLHPRSSFCSLCEECTPNHLHLPEPVLHSRSLAYFCAGTLG